MMDYGPVFAFILSVIVVHTNVNGSLQPSQAVVSDMIVLQEYLMDSHHTPLCVLLHASGSRFEKKVSELWYNTTKTKTRRFTSWRLAMFDEAKVLKVPRHLMVNSDSSKSPLLRCFLGPTLSHDFLSADHKASKQLLPWLNKLTSQHEHMVTVSVGMIQTSINQSRFTLVVFPTVQQHYEIENSAFMITEALSSETKINVVVVHPSSVNQRHILETYEITSIPSILLFDKDITSQDKPTLYSIHDVTTGKLETDLRAKLIPVHGYNLTDFKADVMTVNQSESYRPYLIGFYAHWEKSTSVFLSFLRQTVEEFASLQSSLRFGLINSAKNAEVVSKFMTPNCMHHLPFLVLFQKEDGTSSVNKTEILLTRPSPFAVYTALQEAGFTLTDRLNQPIKYQPYGYNTEVCSVRDGPQGDMCSAGNATWFFPADYLSKFLQLSIAQIQVEDVQMDSGIPVATSVNWSSTSSSHNQQENVTVRVSVFIFVQYQCRSCEQNLPAFQEIYQQLAVNDSYSVHLVNCTVTRQLCEENHVTGFPTILAFRWHNMQPLCEARCSQHADCPHSVRQEYHGVLTVRSIMGWLGEVSAPVVKPLFFNKPTWVQRETAQLVATIVPKDSKFLPLSPNRDRGYFYSTHCFQLACEHLFGLARCYTSNSADIPASQFDNSSVEFVITQVTFRRRDGVEVVIMQLGQALAALLEKMTDHDLHMFHQHHNYQLKPKQKCEEDHGQCTQFLEAFTRDHLRLPVTPLTSDILHSQNNFLFGKTLPVLLALIVPEESEDFTKVLEELAYTLYKEVVVATLDVAAYPAWAGNFVPHDYSKLHAESPSWGELAVYPRLVLFYWYDHTKAAFYPPVTMLGSTYSYVDSRSEQLSEELILQFVRQFLQDPSGHLIQTQHF